jgi:hypothetical protein
MTSQRNHHMVVLSLVAALFAGCKVGEEKQANEKVDRSNTLFDEARSLYKKADGIKAEAVGEADEAKRIDGGKKCKAKYDEAIEKVDEAATLMKDASKLRVTKEFAEYLSLKSKNLEKISEGLGKHADMCVALTKTPDEAKLAELVKDAKSAFEEAEELSEKAEKVREANSAQFKN